jgi:quercetin 2,3-dioxygenase
MKITRYPAANRQHVAHGQRFDSWQSFSFGPWYDAERTGFGTLRVFNDDTIGPDSEIGMHPHENYEILSVMLDGKMSHQDSSGNYQEIETDAIQLISCGDGIYHAGKNLAKGHFTHFLQIWVEPNVRDTTPSLQLQQFNQNDAIEQWDLRVSPSGQANTIQIKQYCYASRGVFSKNTHYKLYGSDNGVWLFVLKGNIAVNGIAANTRDALMISGADHLDIEVSATTDLWLMELPVWGQDK